MKYQDDHAGEVGIWEKNIITNSEVRGVRDEEGTARIVSVDPKANLGHTHAGM